MLYILYEDVLLVLTKLPTATYAQQTILRKLAGRKNSIRRPHVARACSWTTLFWNIRTC